ncbi:hypothetical protein [Ktedonobacter racemifer]|uniref:hypothetical protein n=1 Tax=Ktedonobacter racemifer TaxID=363277 RepID=UPI000309DA6C|nr:hypothetical protein [Ktedonobacter racemifer]
MKRPSLTTSPSSASGNASTHAQQKAVETARRAETAIVHLLKEQRPVNFKTVAETAGISTA